MALQTGHTSCKQLPHTMPGCSIDAVRDFEDNDRPGQLLHAELYVIYRAEILD